MMVNKLNKNSNNHSSKNNQKKNQTLKVNREKLEVVKEILKLFEKSFAQMKIFSEDHTNVIKFTDQLYEKICIFLEKYWKLELGVDEFSFSFSGETVFTDIQIRKSIPFLFHKDGVQILFFYKGLKKEEFLDFLDVIKNASTLPAEESDIAISLWEKDFANIRYFAPDDFLESKIGAGIEQMEYKLDQNKLFAGKIELDPEDQKALRESTLAQKILNDSIEKPESKPESSSEAEKSSLTDEEKRKLENMILSNRKLLPKEELLSLVIEMLYLEQRPAEFSKTIDILTQCHMDILKKGDLAGAVQNIKFILELKKSLSYQSDRKAVSIDKFLKDIKDENSLSLIEDAFRKGKILEPDALLEYLQILGSGAIPLLNNLYEESKSPDFRIKALSLLKEIGKHDLKTLMNIAQNKHPAITNEIISILETSQDKNAVQYLSSFVSYENKSIKVNAIKALGKFQNNTANNILLAFLSDEEKELRIIAAQNLQYTGDKSIVEHILKVVQKKSFLKKEKEEKTALLEFLARSQTAEAKTAIRKILKKPTIFSRRKNIETSLCSISALKTAGNPEVMKILEEGAKGRNRKVKRACKLALKDLSNRNETERKNSKSEENSSSTRLQ
jgi:HEAT repeat protein